MTDSLSRRACATGLNDTTWTSTSTNYAFTRRYQFLFEIPCIVFPVFAGRTRKIWICGRVAGSRAETIPIGAVSVIRV